MAKSVRFEPMSKETRAIYRRPIFKGDDGEVVVGILPVAWRIALELTHNRFTSRKGSYIIHGTKRVPRAFLEPWEPGKTTGIVPHAHCWVCSCQFGMCCEFCQAKNMPLTWSPPKTTPVASKSFGGGIEGL